MLIYEGLTIFLHRWLIDIGLYSTAGTLPKTYSDILYWLVRDEEDPSRSIIRRVRHHRLPQLQSPILHHTPARTWVSLQSVRPVQHCEVCQADFIRIAIDDCGQAKIASIDGVMADLELEVAAVIELGPLQFAIVLD